MVYYSGVIIFLGLIGISIYHATTYNVQRIGSGPMEVLEIAEKFEAIQNGVRQENNVLLARKLHITYYLKMKFHPIPLVKSADELLEYCRLNHIDYVFISEVEVKLYSELLRRLDSEHPLSGFSPVVETDFGDAILYRVEGEGTE